MAEAPLAGCERRRTCSRCSTPRAIRTSRSEVRLAALQTLATAALQRRRLRAVPQRLHRDAARGRGRSGSRAPAARARDAGRVKKTASRRRNCSMVCRTLRRRWSRLKRRCSCSATTCTPTPTRSHARSSATHRTRWRSGKRCGCSRPMPVPRRSSRTSCATRTRRREIRQISAAALHALNPKQLQSHAREMVLDQTDTDDIHATSLTALQQFGDAEAVANDKPLHGRASSSMSNKAVGRRYKQVPRAVPQQLRALEVHAMPVVATAVAQSEEAVRRPRRRTWRGPSPARRADRSAARGSPDLRPARSGHGRADARLGAAGAGAHRDHGRDARCSCSKSSTPALTRISSPPRPAPFGPTPTRCPHLPPS